jgi:hypothetical protein
MIEYISIEYMGNSNPETPPGSLNPLLYIILEILDYNNFYSYIWRIYNIDEDYKIYKNWLIFEFFISRIKYLFFIIKKSDGIGIWILF